MVVTVYVSFCTLLLALSRRVECILMLGGGGEI